MIFFFLQFDFPAKKILVLGDNFLAVNLNVLTSFRVHTLLPNLLFVRRNSVFKKNYGPQNEVHSLTAQVTYTMPACLTALTHTQSAPATPITLTDEGCVTAQSLFLTGISVDTLLETARTLSSFTLTGVGQWACVTDDR